VWINILCVAARHDGALPSIVDLAFSIRLSEKEAAKRVEQLVAAGLLERDGEMLRPHNWAGRQPQSDTSTARVQRHRKQLEGAKAVSGNGTEPFHETENETARNGQRPFQETIGNASRNGLESESDQERETESSSSSSAAVHAAEDGLSEKLRQAADGHVAQRCNDVAPIRDLIAKGCDLQLDVLPTIRARVPTLKRPLSTWRAAWLSKEILASRDARPRRTSASSPSPTAGRARKPETRSGRPGASALTAAAAAPSGENWRDLGRSIGDVALAVTSQIREAAVDAPSSGVAAEGQTHES
jgi:hypothetical protein